MSLAENLRKLKEIKDNIRQALINKGAEVTSSTPFKAYAECINNLTIADNDSLEILKGIFNQTLSEIILPKGITKIPQYFFQGSCDSVSLQWSGRYPKAVTKVQAEDVTTVGAHAFSGQYLITEVNLPNCTEIQTYGFQGKLDSSHNRYNAYCYYNLPSLKTIGSYAFAYARGDFSFVKNVETIYSCAFNNAGSTGTAWDLSNIKTIATKAWADASGIVWCPSTIETIATKAFGAYQYIYTDVASADELPSGWTTPFKSVLNTIHYGATYEDFLNAVAAAAT